jgi:hypothetical protein
MHDDHDPQFEHQVRRLLSHLFARCLSRKCTVCLVHTFLFLFFFLPFLTLLHLLPSCSTALCRAVCSAVVVAAAALICSAVARAEAEDGRMWLAMLLMLRLLIVLPAATAPKACVERVSHFKKHHKHFSSINSKLCAVWDYPLIGD